MPIRGTLVKGSIVLGDAFTVDRPVRLKPGEVITNGWLTVKNAKADADPGLFQKAITSTNTPGTGWIEDTGTDGYGLMHFDLTEANTLLLTADQIAYYDIQIKTSSGKVETLEYGSFIPIAQITTSS